MAVTVGSQLQATTESGDWADSPTSYSYQWQEASTSGGSYSNIASATRSDYLVVVGDLAKYIRCQVTATNAGGSSSATNTQVVGPVMGLAVPTNTGLPLVSAPGSVVKVGDTLSCSTGTWTGSPTTFTYQWQSAPDEITWADIGGATNNTLLIDPTLQGDFIRCGVVAYNAAGPS